MKRVPVYPRVLRHVCLHVSVGVVICHNTRLQLPNNQAWAEQRLDKVSFVSLCSWNIFISCTNQQWHVKSSWVTITDLSLERVIAQLGGLMSWLVFPEKLSSSPAHPSSDNIAEYYHTYLGNSGKASSLGKTHYDCLEIYADSKA